MAIEATARSRAADAPDSSAISDTNRGENRSSPGLASSLASAAPYLALLVVGLGVGLRLVGLGREGFWLDEVYSAAFANLSLPGTLLTVLLVDVHPPLYYLQLNVWGWFGQADTWLLLNSVAWSTATLLAVYFGVRREFGAAAGLLALALCAVLGGEIFFAHELRMYPMASCLAVLAWSAGNRVLRDYRYLAAVPLIGVLALLGAIHSASLIAASGALLYILPRGGWAEIRRRLPTWLLISASVAATYLPWVLSAATRNSLSHAAMPSLAALAQTAGGWLIGYGEAALPSWLPTTAALGLALGLLAAVLLAPRLLWTVVCLLLWPLAFGALLCVLVQPIWLDRTFAFCAPFVAITFGAALSERLTSAQQGGNERSGYLTLAVFAALILAGARLAYLQASAPSKPDQYRELAGYLASHAGANELIYAPRDVDFWGVSRYLIGPDWGSMMRIEDVSVLEVRKRWRRLSAWLGPAGLDSLGMLPLTRRLDRFRVPFYTGPTPLPAQPQIAGEWLVSMAGEPLSTPKEWNLCIEQYPRPIRFGRLELYHWSCADSPR